MRVLLLISILTLGAEMPKSGELPESISDFVYRNALRLDAGQDFDVHMGRLLRALGLIRGPQAPTP